MPRSERVRSDKRRTKPRRADAAVVADSQKETEAQKVFGWRSRCFMEMGFAPKMARLLADSEADLHAVSDLLENGCSHELAMDIAL